MSEIDFKVVDGDYGEEVALEFDYDEHLVNSVKELREDRHWEVTHCSPVYENDEFRYWAVDRTEESLKRLAEVTGVLAPAEVWPDGELPGSESNGPDAQLVISEGRNIFRLEGDAGAAADDLLAQVFSYPNPEAEHSAVAPREICLYDRRERSAAAGLAPRARDALATIGIDAEIVDKGDSSGPRVETAWLFEHELRPYQRDAVDAVTEQGGGVVAIPTGGGKTVTALRLLHEVGQRAIVFVHTKELLHQWADEVRSVLGVEPGVVGDGVWESSDSQVVVCTMQTLMSKGVRGLGDFGVAIFDECHRTSAADTMHELGQRIDVEWRVGLSATPWRRVNGEEMKIEGATGPEAHSVDAEMLIDEGYLAEPRFKRLSHDGPVAGRHEEYHEAYQRCIEDSDPRNAAVAAEAEALATDSYRVLVNVNRVDQGAELAEAIPGAEFLCGSDSTSIRDEVLADFASDGGCSVLVSTLIKEGVDIPAIDAVILAHGGRSDVSTLQVIGRALRPQGGKAHAMIVDVADDGRFFGRAHRDRWDTMAEYYGSYGPSQASEAPEAEHRAFDNEDAPRDLTAEPPESFDDWLED